MGYFLLFESMLDTVLWARDHYLSDGGHVFPNRCSLHLVGLDDEETYKKRFAFWDDVYGFKMSCMRKAVLAEADVSLVDGNKIITDSCALKVRCNSLIYAKLKDVIHFWIEILDVVCVLVACLVACICSYFIITTDLETPFV